MPEMAETARAWLAPQKDTAMSSSRSARDILEIAGPDMRYTLQGHRFEGCRSSTSVFAISNAGAWSLSLSNPDLLIAN